MQQIARIVVVCLAFVASAHSEGFAGFDCEKAKTRTEKQICKDEALQLLDYDLNATYKEAIKDKNKSKAVRLTQIQWIKERDNCLDATCVKEAYKKRISELAEITESVDFDSGTSKPPACPLCGSWNIDSAFEVLGKGRYEKWDDPIGEVLIVDNSSIVIPYCGSYSYRITALKVIVEDDDTRRRNLTMQLIKISDSTSMSRCASDYWQLNAAIGVGLGSASLNMTNTSGKLLSLMAWNPEGDDPDMGRTPFEGRRLAYSYARSSKALKRISDEFFKTHGDRKIKTFDLNRFRASASAYCMNLIVEGEVTTASQSNMVLGCEREALDVKYAEFNNWHCGNHLSQGADRSQCKFPDESVNLCKHNSQPGSELARMQSTFCPQ